MVVQLHPKKGIKKENIHLLRLARLVCPLKAAEKKPEAAAAAAAGAENESANNIRFHGVKSTCISAAQTTWENTNYSWHALHPALTPSETFHRSKRIVDANGTELLFIISSSSTQWPASYGQLSSDNLQIYGLKSKLKTPHLIRGKCLLIQFLWKQLSPGENVLFISVCITCMSRDGPQSRKHAPET